MWLARTHAPIVPVVQHDDQLALVVAAPIRLALVGAFVAPRVHKLAALLAERCVDGRLAGAQHELPDVLLYGIVVE